MLRPADPAQQLKPYVRKYVQLDVLANQSPLFWPIPARSTTCLEFTFGSPYQIHHLDGSCVETTHPATLIGAKSRRRIALELSGHVQTFVILLEPLGLQRLFSLPGTEIVDEHFAAETVLGPTLVSLRTRLGEAKSFQERVQVVDAFLSQRSPGSSIQSQIDSAVVEIIAKRGCVLIKDLANQLGVGTRQFERRFVHDLGISPKRYARIVRFEAAIKRKESRPENNWTEIAHELGYHDQMHMIHDFRLLSGETPSSLAPQFELLTSIMPSTS